MTNVEKAKKTPPMSAAEGGEGRRMAIRLFIAGDGAGRRPGKIPRMPLTCNIDAKGKAPA